MTAYGHTPGHTELTSETDVASAERLLADWFERPVVLTSSGRAAMLLYLRHLGLNRYRHRVALPRLISACVLDVVIRCGFPVDSATGAAADATIHYHQYGLTQRRQPTGDVLDDICHAFFATPETGARAWSGPAAVFSLPKFFRTSTMVGGLVVADDATARSLRAARDAQGTPDVDARLAQAQAFRRALLTGGQPLEAIYLERMLTASVLDQELGGVPASLAEIREIGRVRRARVTDLLGHVPRDSFPADLAEAMVSGMPFAVPLCGAPDALAAANRDLAGLGVSAGLYQIDVARDASAPRLQKALLVPVHHGLPAAVFAQQCDIVANRFGGER